MNRRNTARLTLVCLLLVAALTAGIEAGKPISVKGYVLDSACAFTKNLKKPISAECAVACAKAGSPLVILSDDGIIYWPIAYTTPSSGHWFLALQWAVSKSSKSIRARLDSRWSSSRISADEGGSMKLKSLDYGAYRFFAEHSSMRYLTAKTRLGDSIQKQSGIYRSVEN